MKLLICTTMLLSLVLILLGVDFFASELQAYGSGAFSYSGRFGSTCAACHYGPAGASIDYAFTPVDPGNPPFEDGYVPGATYDVTVVVTGGPGVRYGFAWDSDDGAGEVTDPVNTKRNPSGSYPSNFTMTSAGSYQSEWGFRWNAPNDTNRVTFWGAGISTNGSGTSGDSSTTSLRVEADPIIPAHLSCRTGNVNAGVGDTVDVVFLNGNPGEGPERRITMTQSDPFLLTVADPPSIPGGPANFVLYFFLGEPSESTVRTLPQGLGEFCMPIYLTDANPVELKKLTNNIGKEPQLGESSFPSVPAPSTVLDKPNGVGKVATISIQGLILDPDSPQGQAAVTNAILVELLP